MTQIPKDLLTDDQRDVLTEIINIGFGRASASLSALVGQRVLLILPEISLHSIETLNLALENIAQGPTVIVQQGFTGNILGSGLLFMDSESASTLVDLLSGGSGVSRRLMPSDREALLEVGNILLNAFLGSFANLLHLGLKFSLPDLSLDTMTNVLTVEKVKQNWSSHVLLVKAEFHFKENRVVGYIALIISIDSLDIFMDSINRANSSD